MEKNAGNKIIVNRILIVIFCVLFLLFTFSIVVKAENLNESDNTRLETAIEDSIDTVLEEYLANMDLNNEVKVAIDNVITEYLNGVDRKNLEELLKESIKSALIGSSAKLNSGDKIQSEIKENSSETLKGNLNKIQEAFEKAIVDKTYEYSNSMFNDKVVSEIIVSMRNSIKEYNASCYSTDESGIHTYLKPGAKLISDEAANQMIAYVQNNIKNYTSIEDQLSSTIKVDTTEFIYLADLVTDYLYTTDLIIETANENGASLTKVDRLANYINGENIIKDIKAKLNVEITDELKNILKNSVNQYLESCSGKSIFNDIKTGIYYYIQEKGGFDEVVKDGFSEQSIEYISEQITKIVGGNIEYQVAPYIATVVEDKLGDILVELSHNYIVNGVEQLLKDSVPYGITQRFEKSLSDIMKKNLTTYANSYLKSLVNNSRLRNLINSQFSSYTNKDYAYEILYNVGTKWKYTYDENGAVVDKYEIDTEGVIYARNTLLPTIKNGVKVTLMDYMNGEKGYEIISLAKSNVYDTLIEQILNPLVIKINDVMANWVKDGIVADIWDSIKEKVCIYLVEIGSNMESFEQETGILLGDILMEVRYDGVSPYNRRISLEDLSDLPNLISAMRGAIIPARHSEMVPLEDATVEVGFTSRYEQLVEDSGTSKISDPSRLVLDLINPFAPNPYGLTVPTAYGTFGIPGPAGISRTLADYSTKGIRNLTASEAYILAHEKNTGYYPDYVQMAYWNLDGKTGEEDEGCVDMELYENIMNIIKIGSTISGLYVNFMNLYGSFVNLMSLNFSSIFDFNFDFWTTLSFDKIGSFFSSLSLTSILDQFSLTGMFENLTLVTFLDTVCTLPNLQQAGEILDYCINAGVPTDPLSIAGALFWSPINPYIGKLSGSDIIKIYRAANNMFYSSRNFIVGVEEVYNIVSDYFMPKQREIVDYKNPENPIEGMELYGEAKALEDALYRYNDFQTKNGATLVDRTDYEKVEVSYSKKTDEILVGPFTIDYIREFYCPLFINSSELVDRETDLISFTGIIGAELYADDAKTIPISGWKFVYPDKERNIVSPYDSYYEYPYPNEEFYLQFPSTDNYSVNTLSKMRFQLEKMDADGQVYELEGEYDQLLWVGVDLPIVCPLPPARCICGVIGGHPWPSIPPTWCPVVNCLLHRIYGVGPVYHQAYNGHLFGHYYFCQQVPLGTGLDAMDLEQVIYSKIYKEYQYVDIELGEQKPYYIQSVNNTQHMANSERKGNITENVNNVPVLPFLPNYDTYPRYPDYPDYEGSPNYPDNPYTFNNEEYKDYASYPQYNKGPQGEADPTYPYYPDDEIIPLTFHISGTVWLDNPSGKESDANGIIEEHERGIPNVEVIVYKKGDPDYVSKTLTDENGYYIFEYLRVGFDYYVEFAYDGMTYRSTEYLQSDYSERNGEDMSGQTQKYMKNPENYLTSSQALENASERDAFNDKFYHISENLATAKDGNKIPLEYKNWQTPNGTVSTTITVDEREITKEEFKMYARTMETNLYFPVDEQYQVDFVDLDLYGDGSDMYTKTYPCLEHINFGLIQREQGDFTTKTDAYQVITTIKEDVQRYKYNEKDVNDNTYDILFRTGDYYTRVPYNQELNPDDCSYRYDSTYGENANIVSTVLSEKDELNVYVEYKILMKNRATLESGRLIEVENSFDANLEYIPKYDFTDLASWIEVPMDGTGENYKQEILWDYREGSENGYLTIYTDDLKDKSLKPGEVIEIHLILKVRKDNVVDRNLRMDLAANEFKEDITEITVYSYDEGLMDKTSNPGSARLGNTTTYADGTDTAPLLKVIYDRDYNILNSNTLQGYAWEDLITNLLSQNNQLISNGLVDEGEKKINNIKVELVEVVIDKETGKEVEVLRKTASGTEYYRTGEDIRVEGQTIDIKDGEYKFLKLETGTYRVKFTYGDEYQLTKDLTYNAQDYKTLSLDTIYQQYYSPKLEVMLMLDTSETMSTDDKGNLMRRAIVPLVDSLYKNIQTVKIGGYMFSGPAGGSQVLIGLTEKPSVNNLLNIYNNEAINVGKTLSDTIRDALTKFSNDANGKVILIMTDGYMTESAKDKQALLEAEKQGVKVITVACSTDEWDASTFGTEENPTTGTLYNIRHKNITQYVSEVVLEDILLEFENILPNLTDAKDVQSTYSYYVQKVLFEDIYGRKRNIDYSSTLVNDNAEVLDIQNIRNIQRQLNDELKKSAENQNSRLIEELRTDISNRIKMLAENTKVTAITPNRNIVFLQNSERTKEINLGLVERPKVELKIEEKISRIKVKLSNGEVIIDTARNLTQNVQHIPNDKYTIFMDEEVMQGATLDIEYKITVTNNGQVDTLADYFTYDMFNEEEVFYATTTVANRIGTLYDYYTNNTFRATDNNNLNVEINNVELRKLNFDGVILKNWQELVEKGKTYTPEIFRIYTRLQNDGRSALLNEKITWDDNKDITLNENVEKYIDNDEIKVVKTKSLRDISIFPNISKEALSHQGVSSISFYVQFSKQLSSKDDTDTLQYKNSTEIVERLNAVGRRDYQAKVGNYMPHYEKAIEYDSEFAEDVIILPPFGENRNYIPYVLLAISGTLIFIIGVVFIRKKVV